MPIACLIEVEALAGRDPFADGRRRAFVKVFFSYDQVPGDIVPRVQTECAKNGFRLINLVEVKPVGKADVPADRKSLYDSQGIGFGPFHTYPNEDMPGSR